MSAGWTGAGPEYELAWAGRLWTLDVGSRRPGLVSRDARVGPLLSLDAISATGRSDASPFGGSRPILHEVRLGRLEATYAPSGWESLRLRASWTSRGAGRLDLEVQVQASSVDELKAVRVHVASWLGAEVLPSPGPASTFLSRVAGPPGVPAYYLEIVHPEDVAPGASHRRPEPLEPATRHALFGYDLEKGVVVRGRLRGVWLDSRPDAAETSRLAADFLGEPIPLGP